MLRSALQSSRAAFAEPDDERLLRRLQAVAGSDLSRPAIEQLASGDLSHVADCALPAQRAVMALIDTDSGALGALERMVGSTLDYVGVAFLDAARAAAQSVVRICDRNMQPLGTGIMVSDSVLLTNNHVTASEEEAREQIVQLGYELDHRGAPMPTREVALDPASLFLTSHQDELDFTLVALGRRLRGASDPSRFGFVALSGAGDKHAVGDFMTVIQHPGGDEKQIALRENRLIGAGRGGTTVHYGADTLEGSSGSPIFNDQFELVALHHAGGPRNEPVLQDGSAVPTDSNEGIRVSAIVGHLRRSLEVLAGARRDRLAAALDPAFRGPSLLAGSSPLEAGPPQPRAMPAPVGDGWSRTVVPIEIALRASGTPVDDAVGRARPRPAALTGGEAARRCPVKSWR